MTITNHAELTSRHRTRRTGSSGSPFESLLQTRDRKIRRGAQGLMTLVGGERLDMSRIERQSLFEHCGPERC